MSDWRAVLKCDQFDYPSYAHVPGQNPRHSEFLFSAICVEVRPDAKAGKLFETRAWRQGICLYLRGYNWESHELLEAVWINCPPNSAERYFVQGFIQLANGHLKLAMNRNSAARRLYQLSSNLFREAGLSSREDIFGVPFSFAEQELQKLRSKIKM